MQRPLTSTMVIQLQSVQTLIFGHNEIIFLCVSFLNCFLFCVCTCVFVIREELVTFCFFLRNNIASVWNNSLSMCHQGVSICNFISKVIFVPANSLLYSACSFKKPELQYWLKCLVESSTSVFFIDSSWELDLYYTMDIGRDQSYRLFVEIQFKALFV